MRRAVWPLPNVVIAAAIIYSVSGCTGPRDYLRNGFKVGPNPCVSGANTSSHWIDAADRRVCEDFADVSRWWSVFQDPTLDRLIAEASSQNLSLREAGYRVLEARAQLGIAQGNIFPQSQNVSGGYQRAAASEVANGAPGITSQFFDQWAFGFNLSWELDFWGRFRRAIAAAEHSLDASCANYDDVLVTLLGDVASNYIQVRTLQHRIELARTNIELQSRIFEVAEKRMKTGARNALDAHQARSDLTNTKSQIPQLRIALRQACNRLCILLGTPPRDLEQELGSGPIPTAPSEVVIGIPVELLRRRPDVRRAEHEAAAQAEQIGIAEADLYPMFGINGTFGYQAMNFPELFSSKAITGNIGPVFQWNILNYGRIRNNMRLQDARFQRLLTVYQNTVLRASAEVEDGLVTFLRAQERAQLLDESVSSAQQADEVISKEYGAGKAGVDFNRVALIEQNLVQRQDLQAQSHGEIAQGLIQVYRALGGGWQTSQAEAATPVAPLPPDAKPQETMPAPPSDALSLPIRRPLTHSAARRSDSDAMLSKRDSSRT